MRGFAMRDSLPGMVRASRYNFYLGVVSSYASHIERHYFEASWSPRTLTFPFSIKKLKV